MTEEQQENAIQLIHKNFNLSRIDVHDLFMVISCNPSIFLQVLFPDCSSNNCIKCGKQIVKNDTCHDCFLEDLKVEFENIIADEIKKRKDSWHE